MSENAENKQLKWTIDNPKVVTVKNGLIKAVRKGTATIAATSQDGSNRTASCKIIVQESTISHKKIQVITGTNHYKKTAGCKPFYLDVKLGKEN